MAGYLSFDTLSLYYITFQISIKASLGLVNFQDILSIEVFQASPYTSVCCIIYVKMVMYYRSQRVSSLYISRAMSLNVINLHKILGYKMAKKPLARKPTKPVNK